MSVALNAVMEQDEISGDDRLHYVAERASELAMEALADLEAINLPRLCMANCRLVSVFSNSDSC